MNTSWSRNLKRAGTALVLAGSTLVASALQTVLYVPAPPNEVASGGLTLKAVASAPNGWVPPGGNFAFLLVYKTGASAVPSATITATLSAASVFEGSTPAPISGNGTSGAPLTYTIGPIAANTRGTIVIEARAKDLDEDPEVVWKPIPANVTLTVLGQPELALRSHGPKVTTLETARFGDRPFPIVMVDFQDIKHCDGDPAPDCTTGVDHNATMLDNAVNSRTSGRSIWQLFQDLSFGQLYPDPTVMPRPNTPDTAFDTTYKHRFSQLEPNGTCNGTTVANGPVPTYGTPAYPNRVVKGWYQLPGTQGYYGSDSNGAFGAVNPVAPTVDDGCGPTGKLVYDAASLADPDLDYNDFDTDKDGLVDFFNLVFPGVGGNTLATPTSVNNIWPHSSSLEYYYTDEATGLKGYISNDQFRNQYDQPMYYTDDTYRILTTDVTAYPAYVRVGPYNVNPETAIDKVSVIAHEYGHSLGLPDFYSNSFDAFGTWELMGEDRFQYMTVFARQEMGWVVPRTLEDGTVTVRESKYDTGEIHWQRPDRTPYVLSGEGIHNADVYKVALPPRIVIDQVPSGSHAWHSGAGSDFGCPPNSGHNLDVYLPDMAQTGDATSVTLTFQSLYQIEWDWDYAFVIVSVDNGLTWQTLPSAATPTTTIQNNYNPNHAGCFDENNNGITGVYAGGGNTLANPNRAQNLYPFGPFIEDRYDLTPFKGKSMILRFSYFTDPAAVLRGWFIDDIRITADDEVLYSSDFESGVERGRLFPDGWTRVSTVDGSPADHAYYLELRARINNDANGKGQDDRGNGPTWQPGISLIYTDEAYGYGNTGVDDHPAQTPVDAVPQPGDDTPNLNDAAFTAAAGRNTFDGCTHVDNYVDPLGPSERWKLPQKLRFTVTSITGLTQSETPPATPATATLDVVVNPVCAFDLIGPTMTFSGGYENPDVDGAFQLGWTRPAGSVGPNTVQRAEACETALDDSADEPLVDGANSIWAGSPQWTSQVNPDTGSPAYFIPDTSEQNEALELIEPVVLPAGVGATLSFVTHQHTEEGFDFAHVDVSRDGGTSWQTLESWSGPGAEPGEFFSGERSIDLTQFAGSAIKVRFRMQSDLLVPGGGWHVEDIRISYADWADVATTSDATYALTDHDNGEFCYRVRTQYPAAGETTVPSAWSNVLVARVNVPEPPVALISVPAVVTEAQPVTLDGSGSSDGNGDTLTYAWTQTTGQGTHPVTLAGANTSKATFTAPAVCTDTPLGFTLTVGDGQFTDTATAAITIDNLNNAPFANAGQDFTSGRGATAMLSAANTTDEDCEPLDYSWAQIGGPVVALSGADSANASFTVPADAVDGTEYTFRLTVTDPEGVASSDDLTVTVDVPVVVEPKKEPEIGNANVGGLPPASLLLLGLLGLARRVRGSTRFSRSGNTAKR